MIHAAPPPVQVAVVGRDDQVVVAPRTVRPTQRRFDIGRKTCTVGASTPLAALLAAKAPGVRARDEGACGRSARDAGSLYVTRIGRDSARGPSGWVYKVDGKAGTTGAADPSGAFGTGRKLRRGQRVLWFWCTQDAEQSCQPTLELRPSGRTIAAGQPFTVRVLARGDDGRAVVVPGATVTAGAAGTAVAGQDGVATLVAPAAAGRLKLSAAAPGRTRGFDESVTVR